MTQSSPWFTPQHAFNEKGQEARPRDPQVDVTLSGALVCTLYGVRLAVHDTNNGDYGLVGTIRADHYDSEFVHLRREVSRTE